MAIKVKVHVTTFRIILGIRSLNHCIFFYLLKSNDKKMTKIGNVEQYPNHLFRLDWFNLSLHFIWEEWGIFSNFFDLNSGCSLKIILLACLKCCFTVMSLRQKLMHVEIVVCLDKKQRIEGSDRHTDKQKDGQDCKLFWLAFD